MTGPVRATPGSSAELLAARVNTTEPKLDSRLTNGSPAEHRRAELLAALRKAGLQEHAQADPGLARVLSLAPDGDVAVIADEIATRIPEWFTPAPSSSATTLAAQLQSGVTAHRPGGVH